MRKKSHISLGGYLADCMDIQALNRHKKAFCVGNVLPDCKPSFLTTRHEFDPTFKKVKEDIEKLIEFGERHAYIGRVYFRDLGQVIHFIADYFTFPHNKTYPGNLKDHCKYENDLKLHLREIIRNGEAEQLRREPVYFETFEELIEYVKEMHQDYLSEQRSVREDCEYIINTCSQMVFGILYLLSVSIQQSMELAFA